MLGAVFAAEQGEPDRANPWPVGRFRNKSGDIFLGEVGGQHKNGGSTIFALVAAIDVQHRAENGWQRGTTSRGFMVEHGGQHFLGRTHARQIIPADGHRAGLFKQCRFPDVADDNALALRFKFEFPNGVAGQVPFTFVTSQANAGRQRKFKQRRRNR